MPELLNVIGDVAGAVEDTVGVGRVTLMPQWVVAGLGMEPVAASTCTQLHLMMDSCLATPYPMQKLGSKEILVSLITDNGSR